ncbi:hypothetical protein GGH94_002794 [Coemansia aciculifera]|uniref:Uncharacterized protein n=2 Tax=Coemansia TaxID=4863 RepID=A0A9W8H2D4_9FUNG|nr:hypothetical protein GGI19_001271 [Coemansia pectinata]KAJ2864648.1 hypothetical protein GGH94_002794 [Coemansia aciculifera]KAJ2874188.1 hypothetical protein GGH93_002630 [Coemansia aciculifera]KAJ2878586.1 hypothetical protein H4R27_005750 [Coemansia aciculifera]
MRSVDKQGPSSGDEAGRRSDAPQPQPPAPVVPSSSAMEEPSAPPLLPPSYDDVLSSIHSDASAGGSNRRDGNNNWLGGSSSTDRPLSSSSAPHMMTPPLPHHQGPYPAAGAESSQGTSVGPFGDHKSPLPAPASPGLAAAGLTTGESEPLITVYATNPPTSSNFVPGRGSGDPGELSSRDFFASLEYKRSSKGYSSADPWLNTNSRALLRFITECNERPRVSVEVVGSHTENRVVESTRTENGQTRCETHTHQESIVDFKFSLELTPYVHDKGSLYTARGPTGEPYDISTILEDYVRADNFLKEIRVQKKVIWDYELVRREISDFIKTTGYPHTVTVSFPMEHDRISVKSHNAAAKIWRHPICSFLCLITCACIVGWPMQYFATTRWRNKLMSDFVVLASPRDFVDRNSSFIRNQVSWSARPCLFTTTC